jgi:uncharacterized membrane protein
MSFCAKCGALQIEGAAYCPTCGNSWAVSEASVQAAQTTVNSAPSTGAGITPNVAGALSYLFGVVSGITFLVLDPFKRDRFVRFHAFQSILVNVAWVGLWIVWMVFTGVFEAVSGGFLALMIIPVDCLLTLAGIAYWGFLIYRAYAGDRCKIPFLGQIAEQQANK